MDSEDRIRKLLVSGATERKDWFQLGDGKAYDAAKLHCLDVETGRSEELLTIDTGGTNYPSEHPNLQFTAGYTDGSQLWLPTDTEVRLYDYPSLKLQRTISYPFFNNIHSVARIDDLVAVTSTGLDLVALLDANNGRIVDLINVAGKDVWHRHRPNIDYRLVHSTRPHEGHPNYVFSIQGELWVTRCTFDDAVRLRDISDRIDIGRGKDISAHDGVVEGNYIYFTTVDGGISIASAAEKSIVEDIDLKKVERPYTVRGWCRGLLLSGDYAFVGFSKLRKTRNSRKVKWMNLIKGAKYLDEASVVCYERNSWKKVDEWRFAPDQLSAIYGLMREPDS